MSMHRSSLLLAVLLILVGAVWSYISIAAPGERTLDQRVSDVASQLKCPVCSNESVDSSSASISEQMRQVIRQQLQSGKSEQEVLRYFEQAYGSSILLTPPRQGFTLLAWWVPVAILLIGIVLLGFLARGWRKPTANATEADLMVDAELEPYRAQLEQELANDDPFLYNPGMEI